MTDDTIKRRPHLRHSTLGDIELLPLSELSRCRQVLDQHDVDAWVRDFLAADDEKDEQFSIEVLRTIISDTLSGGGSGVPIWFGHPSDCEKLGAEVFGVRIVPSDWCPELLAGCEAGDEAIERWMELLTGRTVEP